MIPYNIKTSFVSKIWEIYNPSSSLSITDRVFVVFRILLKSQSGVLLQWSCQWQLNQMTHLNKLIYRDLIQKAGIADLNEAWNPP